METAKLRAWWSYRQGLDGRLSGRSASEVLETAGWARSVGGVSPYLALFARAGLTRQAVDDAVARLEICELPAARGCTYVVPASDFALALRAGQAFAGEAKAAARLGITGAEIDRLCAGIIDALARGPLDAAELRQAAAGPGPLAGAMPAALEKLQAAGEIRRIPVNGRLDQQRYRYALWRPGPLEGSSVSPAEAATALAMRYFEWIGPASLAAFRAFSGLGVKAAKAAIEPLALVPPEPGSELLMPGGMREQFHSFQLPREPQYVLAGSIDSIVLLPKDMNALMTAEDARRKVFDGEELRPAGGLSLLPSHAIFDRGRLIGLWEYDVGTQSIAWQLFVPRDSALDEAVRRTEEFIRAQLGDARAFSLDSPKSRAPRVEALRKAAAR